MAQTVSLTKKQTYWLRHVQACDSAGMTMRGYAEANGLKVADFYSWKKSLRSKGLLAPGAKPSPSLFKRAQVMASGGGLCRLLLPSGLTLEFEPGTDPRWLAELLGVLP